ncbi:MAG: glycerol-3-phosphate dehydrogenase/oxidase [Candidatus Omnitrophota bacterium]
MERNLERFIKKKYDLLVIGGGINGAGIAHLAQDHGLKAALIEKGDFASGTSSKSTKLIHGGIRYLENFDFGLVIESLRERIIQLKAAPHLIKPLTFIIPVYKNDRRPLWMMKLGVFLYDCLAGKNSIGGHRRLSGDMILKLIPEIRREGLQGGILYHDAQMDDARLCLENILSAREKGADVINYVEALSFLKEGEKVTGVLAKDTLGGATFEIRAEKVICAAGPWSNLLLRKDCPSAQKIIRMTKGAHIVYEGRLSEHAILLPSDRDGRIFFAIPWMGHSLIGSTDTNYVKTPDAVKVLDEDIRYLAESIKRVFPDLDFSSKKIISSFAGVRALIRKGGSPSKVTRNHAIIKTKSGLTFVIGGKYTTYRKVAEDTLQKVFNLSVKKPFRLYGSGQIDANKDDLAKKYDIGPDVVRHLMDKYGTRYQDILNLIAKDKSLTRKICGCSPIIEAQLVYSIQNEMAVKSEDIIQRRLSIQFLPCETKECHSRVVRFIQDSEHPVS